MLTENKFARLLIALVGCLSVGCLNIGCSLSHAPKNWLPARPQAGEDPFGAWVDVWIADREPPLSGELIAVNADSLYLLADSGLKGLEWKEAKKYRIAFYRSEGAHQGMIVFTSMLGTLSHGGVLLLSAPIWASVGGLTAALAPLEPIYSSGSWETFAPFSRFPQGIPSSLDRGRLLPKLPAPEKSSYQEPYMPLAIIGILQFVIGAGLASKDYSSHDGYHQDDF
jgi:hypothetical protein